MSVVVMTLSPAMCATEAPPVMEARRWLDGVTFPGDRPLINVSQAAPIAPPPEPLRQAMADLVMTRPEVHLYGPVLGLPELRAEIAAKWSAAYGGTIDAGQVAITSGCNEAFAATISAVADRGDEVILPAPWYFNHAMWLSMAGIKVVPLATDAGLLPDAGAARDLITDRTRAIVLVTPNNPGGVEYPPHLLDAFRDLASAKGLALIVDETYRDFYSGDDAPHRLFADPDWDETLVQLYSFSKAYRLTGHRVGAIVAAPRLLAEVEKFLDTVTICPAQLGQHAALWGMQNLSDWLAGERHEILSRRAAVEAGFATLDGWRLKGAGAYFAYAAHPFDEPSDALARRLVREAGILMLPGTMFRPRSDATGSGEVRIAFANVDSAGIADLFDRLRAVRG